MTEGPWNKNPGALSGLTDLSIINAPASLKPTLQACCAQTFAEHRARQPHALPPNALDHVIQPLFDAAFTGVDGQPLDESPVIHVAMVDDVFAGYILLSHWALDDRLSAYHVNIDDIFVDEHYRDQGVAGALLEKAKSIADDQDWGGLQATVWSGNTASDTLFSKHGFLANNTVYRYGPDRQAVDYPTSTPAQKVTGAGFHTAVMWISIGFVLHAVWLATLPAIIQ